MIRRLLTAALPALLLVACGMPEDASEAFEGELDFSALRSPDQVVSTQDPVPASDPTLLAADAPQALVIPGPNGANFVLFFGTGPGPGSPGGDCGSTQDPIPAKGWPHNGSDRAPGDASGPEGASAHKP